MTPKLFRAAEVCKLAQLPSYILQSWEKEFPGIGVQKAPDSPRLYRQSDVDQVLRIKQLVVTEGLTLAGARRRIEEDTPRSPEQERQEVAEVIDALSSDARTRIAHVRDGLRSILQMLSGAPGTVVVVDVGPDTTGTDGPGRGKSLAPVRRMVPKGKASAPTSRPAPKIVRHSAKALATGRKAMAKVTRPLKSGKGKPVTKAAAKAVAKGVAKKRARASA
jgi:DNA-binding transcriptional MerR regulator